MKLYYFPGFDGRWNFGDLLNPWLWERMLPGVLDEDDSSLFIGIGTLLNKHVPWTPATIVFGSGAGYSEPPECLENWTVYCVRGPLTAHELSLPPSCVATDPGALAARVYQPESRCKRYAASYMPHISNANPLLEAVCESLDLYYIDPTWSVERVFDAIAASEMLVTEALHGAITADAMRVPWVPVVSSRSVLEFKWHDWCASLNLDYTPQRIRRPLQFSGHNGPIARRGRSVSSSVTRHTLGRVVRNAEPVLSDETLLERKLSMLEKRLNEFKLDCADGKFQSR